jgi:hypothetical protein
MDDQWSTEWPKEPGYYWVYGDLFSAKGDRPELALAQVAFGGGKRPFYIAKGNFIYESDSCNVHWRHAYPPAIPEWSKK